MRPLWRASDFIFVHLVQLDGLIGGGEEGFALAGEGYCCQREFPVFGGRDGPA